LKKYIFFSVLLSHAALASDIVPQSYQASDNTYRPVTITSSLDSTGKPVVNAYRGSDGQWHRTVVSVQTCGLDAKGQPMVCPPSSVDAGTLTNYIQKSQIGVSNGVAGLDTTGNVTNPVVQAAGVPSFAHSPTTVASPSTATIAGLLWSSPTTHEPLVHLGVPQQDENGQRFGIDPDSLQIGGDYVQDFPGDGLSFVRPDGYSGRGSLASASINCHPYGNYDAAVCLHIMNAAGGREASRSPVGAGLESSTAALASYSAFENVLLELDTNVPAPRLMLQNVTYDATHIWMPGCGPSDSTTKTCIPLTGEQIAQLRIGMTVTTNSIPKSDVGKNVLGAKEDRTVPYSYLYSAFIDSWDASGKSITIRPGWAVMGDPTDTSTVPPLDSLDVAWTQYAVPTVFLGAEAKDFTEHHVIMNSYNGSGGYSLPINQIAHAFSDGETDFQNFSPVDYSDAFQGPTISYSTGNTTQVPTLDGNCNPISGAPSVTRYVNMDPKTHDILNKDACGQPDGHGAYPTADSYGLFVAGGFGTGGGSLLRLTGMGGEREIDAGSLQSFAPQPVGETSGDTREINEAIGQSNGNRIRLATWLQRESDGANGWYNTSLNFGGWIDGTSQNQWAGTTLSGSSMARMSWNSGSNLGGLDFFANNGTDILQLKGDGSTNVLGALNVTGGASFASQLAALNNFVMRGVEYLQTSDGTNQFSLTPGAGGMLTLNPIQSGGGFIINTPTTINNSLKVSGYIESGSYTIDTLPTGLPDGSNVWCSDCVLNNIKGEEVYWHISASKWTDSQNQDVKN